MTGEWRVSREHWERSGVEPFVNGDVPYFVTNNGRLSEDAARVYFANCLEAPPARPHTLLEVGAGTGLFARFFLDVFRDLCHAQAAPFYETLTYLATDASEATCRYWTECGIFAKHAERMLLRAADAMVLELPRSERSSPTTSSTASPPRSSAAPARVGRNSTWTGSAGSS